jgi:hypothetical protein
MGKKTPSASASKTEVTDLAVNAAVGDCPLKRKGDIQVIVTMARDGSLVRGVPVELKGPTPGSGSTDGIGQVRFKDCVPGSYTYEADFSSLNLKYPARLNTTSGTSSKRDKLTTIMLEVEEMSALKVELIEKEGDSEIGPAPDQDVISIAGGGGKEDGKATVEMEGIPAGEVTLTVSVRQPNWVVEPGQTLTVTLVPGVKAEKKIYVNRQAWIALKVHDTDAKKDVPDGRVEMTLPDGVAAIVPIKTGKAERWFAKSSAKTNVTKITTGTGGTDEPIYEFVELTSE